MAPAVMKELHSTGSLDDASEADRKLGLAVFARHCDLVHAESHVSCLGLCW